MSLVYRVVSSLRVSSDASKCLNVPSSYPSSPEEHSQENAPCPTSKQNERDTHPAQEGWTPIKGVVFDMDGTLTKPTLDFVAMHERLNIPPTADILKSVYAMSPEQRADAMKVIEELEREANERLELQPGLLEVIHFLAEHRIQRAIMTRNTFESVEVFLGRVKEKLEVQRDSFPHLSADTLFSKVCAQKCTL